MITKSNFCLIAFLIYMYGVSAHFEWDVPNEVIDSQLHQDVIDSQLCYDQVKYIRANYLLLLQFLDAGIRIPKGILLGNTVDLGNYHQCLGINQQVAKSELQGKYCRIRLPLRQNISFPSLDWSDFNLDDATAIGIEKYIAIRRGAKALGGFISDDARSISESPLSSMSLSLAVCIPRPCTTQQAMTSLIFNVSSLGFQYEDEFCRLPNDKPWVPGDYVAITLFSLLGLLALLGTCYELMHGFILKKDPKTANSILIAFSLYTNGRKFMTFSSKPGSLYCLDGIRALSMLWVIVGHTFSTEHYFINPIDTVSWQTSLQALWITSGLVSVDTFFTLGGLLTVYTTAGKFTSMQLLKNLHLFYLHRILRFFPHLAAGVLLEATLFNHMSDGPNWGMIGLVERCRAAWWSTLLHLQNYINPKQTCIGHTWYLAIDVQLHILSPLVLVWVLSGRKRIAWTALLTALLLNLTSATVYNFIMEFSSSPMNFNRISEVNYYYFYYYMNTLTRAPAFLVGMIIGYTLHLYSKEKPRFLRSQIFLMWFCAFALSAFVIYCSYPILQLDWDTEKQIYDSLFNSFIRVIWAIALGLMILACVLGYGAAFILSGVEFISLSLSIYIFLTFLAKYKVGPINWFLSLQMWKLLSRMSYPLYIYHWTLMTIVNTSATQSLYFTTGSMVFKFFGHFALSMTISFILSLIVESPFNNFVNMILGNRYKKPSESRIEEIPKDENVKQL